MPLAARAAPPDRCPWLNAATAAGALGGDVRVTVTPTSCEFVRQTAGHETTLRIEVTAARDPHTQCPPGSEPLKAVGNEAAACAYQGKAGWTAEQVTGRVRDQAFLVRIETNDRIFPAKTLREKAARIAEQVTGILF
jgi:hypothetical protein